jgi:hypothetical protein
MRIFKKLVFALALPLLIGMAGGWFFRFEIASLVLDRVAGRGKEPYLRLNPEKDLREYSARIEEDATILAKYPIFSRGSQGKSDASAYLNPLLSWERSDSWPGSKGRLELPQELLKKLNSDSKFWNIRLDWGSIQLDWSWWKQLEQFDHWNFDRTGPAYGGNENYLILAAPIPNYVSLRDWSKLRLLQGRETGKVLDALKDVRHLAELIMTNETLVSTMVAISLLGLETAFVESFDEKSRARLQWQPISRDVLQRAKRYYWSQPAFADMRLSAETFNRFSKMPVGICQRVHEHLYYTISLRRLLRTDWQEGLRRTEQLIEETAQNCRSGYLREKWKDTSFQGLFKSGEDLFRTVSTMAGNGDSGERVSSLRPKVTIEEIEKYPQLAELFAYLVLGVSEPNWLAKYRDPQ